MSLDRRDEEIRRALEELGPALDRFTVGDAPDELVARTMRRARGQLLAPAPLHPKRTREESRLLPGFGRELGRLLAITVPFAALTALWMAFVWTRLPEWLGIVLPDGLAVAATGAWGVAALTMISLTYGSLPFLAHQRARAKHEPKLEREVDG